MTHKYHDIFDVLPLVPGPFIKAPATRPFRPILHLFRGEIACHIEIDGGYVEGVYSCVRCPADIEENADSFKQVISAYADRVSDYVRHIALVTIRSTEEPMGFLPEGVSYE